MTSALALTVVAALLAGIAQADPCGMVPPIWTGPGPAIERVGLQKTYVFHKDGVETFAVRPGFEGKVDNFGMLIPVPAVPSIKKISDDTFAHIDAAIDPPEVVVYAGDYGWGRRDGREMLRTASPSADMEGLGYRVEEDTVSVVKEEAMGMYTVVVLDAGSARALKLWMDEHDYMYPEGMDEVCQDYVNAGWLFVAIKAKVGQKEGVNPKPGMKEGDVESDRPDGSIFDGHVQGMAFRFESQELVLPMRLASYNEGEMHNVVYILSDSPTAIQDIPQSHVKRQISGEDLYMNLTQPLPLRIYGGDYKDIPEWQRAGLATQRDPRNSNGLARELFASDLLAARMGELSLAFEEREKELLNISERLELRGEEIDRLHRAALESEREFELNAVLMDLLDMTLTVVDGDFQREVLRRDNLHFVSYRMPASENTPVSYHAPTHGAQASDPNVDWYGEGKRWVDTDRRAAALEVAYMLKDKSLPERKQAIAAIEKDGASIFNPPAKSDLQEPQGSSLPWIIAILASLTTLAIGVGVGYRFRKQAGSAMVLLAIGAAFAFNGTGVNASEKPKPDEPDAETTALIAQLHEPAKASQATDKLVQNGKRSVPALIGEAFSSSDIAAQGWAITALGEIGGEDVDRKLGVLHSDMTKSDLVRTWAAAARIKATNEVATLTELADLTASMPALGKPIAKKLLANLEGDSAELLIELLLKVPSLTASLQKAILAVSAEDLARTMTQAANQNTRYTAAAYLGSKFNNGDKTVTAAVVNVYQYDPAAKQSPWDGGALYVPGIQWPKEDGTLLVRNLLEWGVWCDRKEKPDQYWQIHNNLASIGLAGNVGYTIDWNSQDITGWLVSCGKALGKDVILEILTGQSVQDEKKFKDALARME